MKALVCEMCGSQDLVKADGEYVCKSCGTKYSVDEVKKLMVEVSGEVTIDNTEKIANYYQLARRAKMQNNAADAKKYYDLIRREKPTDWEANFYALYYAAVDCVIGNIPSSSQNLANGMDSETDIDKTYSMPKSHSSYRKPRRLSDECREHKREQMTRYNSRDS